MAKVGKSEVIKQLGYLVALIRDKLADTIKRGIERHCDIRGEFKVYDTATAKAILLYTQATHPIVVSGVPLMCVVKCKGIGAGCHKVWLEWHNTKRYIA